MLEEIVSRAKTIFIPCWHNNYRPKFLKGNFLFYYFLALIALKIVIVLFLINLPQNIFFADVSRAILIELANQQREDLGLSPLKENPQLNEAALLKAQDMLSQGYFGHQDPQGINPWYWLKQVSYNYQAAGENLGIGFLDSEEIYQAWNDSVSHKANLVNPNYGDTGIAILQGDFKGNKTTVVVQFFGSKNSETQTFLVDVKEEGKSASKLNLVERQEYEDLGDEARQDSNGFKFNLLKFIAKDYNNLLQKIVFYSIILITLSLIINILIRPDIQDKHLIVKSLGLLFLLALCWFIDKDLILRLIPHGLAIKGLV